MQCPWTPERALDFLVLELQMIMSNLMWELNSGPHPKRYRFLTTESLLLSEAKNFKALFIILL